MIDGKTHTGLGVSLAVERVGVLAVVRDQPGKVALLAGGDLRDGVGVAEAAVIVVASLR